MGKGGGHRFKFLPRQYCSPYCSYTFHPGFKCAMHWIAQSVKRKVMGSNHSPGRTVFCTVYTLFIRNFYIIFVLYIHCISGLQYYSVLFIFIKKSACHILLKKRADALIFSERHVSPKYVWPNVFLPYIFASHISHLKNLMISRKEPFILD